MCSTLQVLVNLRRVLVQHKYWFPRMDLGLGNSIPIVVVGLDCIRQLAGLVLVVTLLGLSRLDDSMVSVLVSLAAVWDFALHEMAVRLVKIVLVARSCESFVSIVAAEYWGKCYCGSFVAS